jgi:tetratricopeptide (TPR) repeat protein
VASTASDIALLYKEEGKTADAEGFFKSAVEIREKSPASADLANSLNNLARFYRDNNKYDLAEPLYKRALEMRKQVLGPNDPSVAAVMRNYAVLLRAMGKADEAKEMDKQARAIEG